MYGYVEWTERRKRVKAGERRIAGTRMLSVSIPRKPGFLQHRRCAAAADILRRAGVTRAIFPKDFPQYALFAERGVLSVEPYILWQALAAELVQFRLEQHGMQGKGVTVGVCAERLTETVRRTVTELCIRSRYVILFTPERDEVLCRRLRREYGVPLVQTEDSARLHEAAVTVRFHPVEGVGSRGDALDLYPGGVALGAVLALPEEMEAQLPEGCERMQLLAALFSAGSIRRGQIRILAPQAAETERTGGKMTEKG